MKLSFNLSTLRLHDAANFLNSRPPRERLLLVGLAVAILLFADYFLWLAPASRSLMETLPALKELKVERDELKKDKVSAAEWEKKWRQKEEELEDKENRIAVSNQTAWLLENLSQLASGSGVRILSLKPADMTLPAGKIYYALPVHIDCLANTHELGAFLNRLETGEVYFKVTDLKVTSNPANERKHAVEMMVETFRKVPA